MKTSSAVFWPIWISVLVSTSILTDPVTGGQLKVQVWTFLCRVSAGLQASDGGSVSSCEASWRRSVWRAAVRLSAAWHVRALQRRRRGLHGPRAAAGPGPVPVPIPTGTASTARHDGLRIASGVWGSRGRATGQHVAPQDWHRLHIQPAGPGAPVPRNGPRRWPGGPSPPGQPVAPQSSRPAAATIPSALLLLPLDAPDALQTAPRLLPGHAHCPQPCGSLSQPLLLPPACGGLSFPQQRPLPALHEKAGAPRCPPRPPTCSEPPPHQQGGQLSPWLCGGHTPQTKAPTPAQCQGHRWDHTHTHTHTHTQLSVVL